MSERIVQTVTPRQLRREFNGIGLTFLIVFGLAVGAAFGYRWLTPLLEPYYQTVDRQAAEMGIRIVVTLLVMLLPFQIYAALKKMKTGRFFGHCQGEWRDILGLVLIGLALICWSISSKVILLAKIWHADFPLANRIPIIPVLTALACLFLAAFLYEAALFETKYFVPARVLTGFGAICFTLYSIVSILESGASKK